MINYRKLRPKVYIKAAKRLAKRINDFACPNIKFIVTGYDVGEEGVVDEFAYWFRPDGTPKNYTWFSDSVLHIDEESQMARSLALLLMAEIAKDEQE